MKKHKRIMSVMAVALILIMSLSSFAFAEQENNGAGAYTQTEPETDVEAALTKTLIMAPGSKTPGVNMTFKFTPVTGDDRNVGPKGESITAESTGHANIGPVSLRIEEGTEKNGTQYGSDVVEAQSGNFLEGVTFAAPGIYVYDVEEETCAFNSNISGTLTKSNAKYRMYLHVYEKADGGTYIKFIGVVQTVKNGTPGSTGWDHSDDEKIDPTPYDIPPTDAEYDYLKNSDMRFVNSYQPTIDNTPPGFTVKKSVAGTTNPEDLNKYFEFEITVNKPPTSTDETFSGSINGLTNNESLQPNGVTLEQLSALRFGETIKVKLKHDEVITFEGVPVGSEIDVKEVNYDENKWTPEIKLYNGSDDTTKTYNDNELKFLQPDYYVNEQTLEGWSSANVTYTNRYKPDTPTGIILNNMPFFLMAAGATVAVVAFAVVKGRKRAANN